MSTIAVKKYKGIQVEHVKSTLPAEKAELQLRDRILQKLLDANVIEAPQDLVDEEVRMMVLEMNQRLRYETLATGKTHEFSWEEMDNQMETFKEEAYRLVKTDLVLKGIIEAEQLEVSKEELEEEVRAIAARQHIQIEMVKGFLGEDLGSLKNDLLIRKAIDLVIANAIIK